MKAVSRFGLLLTLATCGSCDLAAPAVDRLDADAGANQVVPTDTSVTLSGTAAGGLPPYTFRWSAEVQPDGAALDLADASTNATLEVGNLSVEGRYVFRLRVTDSAGQSNASFVTVRVGGDLSIVATAADALRVVGEATRLGATIDADTTGFTDRTYTWEVRRGEAELSDAQSANPTLTVLSADTIELHVSVSGTMDGTERFGVASAFVVGVNDPTPQVVMEVGGAVTGEIVFELLTAAAPKTCANFLRYVDDAFYDGIVWHRAVPDFVIQGGAFERQGDQLVAREGVRDPVESEANNGESNVRGTVAMALRGQDANSGTNQFFVNLGDNANLDDGTPPFTVFARVIKGMEVVDEIAALETDTDPSGLTDVPVADAVMVSVSRAADEIPTDDIDTNGTDTSTNGV